MPTDWQSARMAHWWGYHGNQGLGHSVVPEIIIKKEKNVNPGPRTAADRDIVVMILSKQFTSEKQKTH